VEHQNLKFVPFYSRSYIDDKILETADKLTLFFKDSNPIFVGILNGSFIFLSELIKRVNIKNFQIEMVKIKTYEGLKSLETVKELISLTADITGRDIIIVDDIIDTGITMDHIVNHFKT
jgi:hypoxanthine phosphoribosyltransferase